MVVVREVTRMISQDQVDTSPSPSQSATLAPMVAQKATLSHHALPQSLPPVLAKMDLTGIDGYGIYLKGEVDNPLSNHT